MLSQLSGGRKLRRCCQQDQTLRLLALGWRSALTTLLSLQLIGVCASLETDILLGVEGLAHNGKLGRTEHGSSAHLDELTASGMPHPPAANAWHTGVAAQRLISCYNEHYATTLPYPTFDDFLKQDLPRVWLHRVWWSPLAAPASQHSIPQRTNGSGTHTARRYASRQRQARSAQSGTRPGTNPREGLHNFKLQGASRGQSHQNHEHHSRRWRHRLHGWHGHGSEGQEHGQGPLGVYTMASLDRLSQLEAQCRSVPGVVLSAAVYVPLLFSPTDAGSGKTSSRTRSSTSEGSGGSSTSSSSGSVAEDGDGEEPGGSTAEGAEPEDGAEERREGEAADGGGELGGGVLQALRRAWAKRFGVAERSWLRGVGPRGPQGLGRQQQEALAAAEQQLQDLYTRLESSPTPTCRPVLLMFAELVADAALAASMPTNTLRNAALLPLSTRLVLMADADLSVSSSLTAGGPGTVTGSASPGGLLGNATRMAEILATSRDTRAVFVVPAFEASRTLPVEETSRAADMAVAGNKSVLEALWRGTQPPPLHPFDWRTYVYGHGPTDFNRFLVTDEPYEIKYGVGFEPWFIVARELAPPFDERFRGWNGDKVSQVSYTAYLKYKFMVLPAIWLVHRPHPPPPVRSLFKGEQGAAPESAQIFQKVVRRRFWSMTLYEQYMLHTSNLGWQQRTQQNRGRFHASIGDAFQHCKDVLPWWQDGGSGGPRDEGNGASG